jgi:hypothetical protein
MASTLPPGELFALDALVTPTAQGMSPRLSGDRETQCLP